MKVNWTNIIIIGIILLAFVVGFFLIRNYFDGKVSIAPQSQVVDSLQLVIIDQESNMLEYRKRLQKLEEEKLQLNNQYKHFKNKYYAERNNEDTYVVLPTDDSTKLSIITEYFVEQGVSLYYSR